VHSRSRSPWVLLVVLPSCGGLQSHPEPRIAPVAASQSTVTSVTDATAPAAFEPAVAAREVAPATPQSPRIQGRVLDIRSLSPLAGRIILVGDQRTTTEEDGRFTLDAVPPFYDLFVAEADRSMVSIYEHLSRRDPLVVHEPRLGSVRPGTTSVYGTAVSQAPRTLFTPPSLLAPASGTVVTRALRLSWTPCEHGSTEWYQLSAMNLKLRCYPDFAATVGIQCVRDCAGARAFYKAYAKYARAHPGFDANQPLSCPQP